jgi:hypothetical protein
VKALDFAIKHLEEHGFPEQAAQVRAALAIAQIDP